MREILHAWRDFFSLMWEILHACRETGRNSVQAGDSLSMRESWKPWSLCIFIPYIKSEANVDSNPLFKIRNYDILLFKFLNNGNAINHASQREK